MLEPLQDTRALLRERKRSWLLPIVVVLALLSGLIVLAPSRALAPFVYTLL